MINDRCGFIHRDRILFECSECHTYMYLPNPREFCYYRYCPCCGKKADVTDRIDPMALAGYLENIGWSHFDTKRTDIRIYQKEHGKFFQVTIPMSNRLADYNDALREACKKVAECEGITLYALCRGISGGRVM